MRIAVSFIVVVFVIGVIFVWDDMRYTTLLEAVPQDLEEHEIVYVTVDQYSKDGTEINKRVYIDDKKMIASIVEDFASLELKNKGEDVNPENKKYGYGFEAHTDDGKLFNMTLGEDYILIREGTIDSVFSYYGTGSNSYKMMDNHQDLEESFQNATK